MRLRLLIKLGMICSLSAGILRAEETAVNDLIDALKNSDRSLRIDAITQLSELGPAAKAAVPSLVQLLSDRDDELRWRSSRTLGAIGPTAAAAVSDLTRLLDDDNNKVRAYAAFALGQMGEAAFPALERLIETVLADDPLVRRASLRALRRIDAPSELELPTLVKVLDDADPAMVVRALQTVADDGKEAVPGLCSALDHPRACYWACLVLSEIGPETADAVPHLKQVLEHADVEVRMEALLALGSIGPASATVVPQIVDLLANDDFTAVRYTAAYALGQIGEDVGEQADESLETAIASNDEFLQLAGAWALARIHPGDAAKGRRAASLIVDGLTSQDVHVRRGAARALAEFKGHADIVGPKLVAALDDADPTVVGNTLDALAELGSKTVPRVAAALEHEDLRGYAARVLQRIGPDAAAAVPQLIAQLNLDDPDQDVEILREVQMALAMIGPAASRAVPDLVTSLDHEHPEVRNSAIYALAKIGSGAQSASNRLRKNLKSDDGFLRLASIWALLQIRSEDSDFVKMAVPELVRALDSDEERVRVEVVRTLGMLGAAAAIAKEPLRECLNDESADVRAAAEDALEALGE